MTIAPGESASPAAPSVSVFGSCVSRDTVEVLRRRGWRLAAYVARQSLLSAGSRVPGDAVDLGGLDSAFVRRVHAQDLAGDRRSRLSAVATQTDVLLWDIMDERLGVLELPGGEVLTRTTEGLAAGLYDSLDARLLEFGSDEHFERWAGALATWHTELTELNLADRTLLLQTAWAVVDEDGGGTPTSWGVRAPEANWLAQRYYRAAVQAVGVQVLRLPDELTIAGAHHAWGPAPFHYQEASYNWLADRVEELLPQAAERSDG